MRGSRSAGGTWQLALRHARWLSTGSGNGRRIPLGFPTLVVWGANTGVGKTLVSAGLAAAVARAEGSLLYLKPVQTGYPADDDSSTVAKSCGGVTDPGPHAARLLRPDSAATRAQRQSASRLAKTLFAWSPAVSPHMAAAADGRGTATQGVPPAQPVSSGDVLAAVGSELAVFDARGPFLRGERLAVVETAGGVASPGPDGTPQCDTLRALRAPALLVGDGRLGGISATLTAYETLRSRGIDVPFVCVAEHTPGNVDALTALLPARETQVIRLPPLPLLQVPDTAETVDCQPAATSTQVASAQSAGDAGSTVDPSGLAGTARGEQGPSLLSALDAIDSAVTKPAGRAAAAEAEEPPAMDPGLAEWLQRSAPAFDSLRADAFAAHAARMRRLAGLEAAASNVLWWPFYQHAKTDSPATVFEAREGEQVLAFSPADADHESDGLEPLYDAAGAWWTQGLNAQGQAVARAAAAAAAGRYGHVIFSHTAHEPGVALAEALLHGPGAGWAARTFYSDNGSTAVEVALKMAFRAYAARQADAGRPVGEREELGVLGLRGAYHGDTLGAMDAVAPSPYTSRRQTPWYIGRGAFLDPPTLAIRGGAWRADAPDGGEGWAAALGPDREFSSLADVFAARAQDQATYAGAISAWLDVQATVAGPRLAACMLEPVLQGAGGMTLVDPAFQRALVTECRRRGMVIVLDEVFTGFWRLGARSGAALLNLHPDVACYGKLLTGGMAPLGVTLAADWVFDAFKGDSKLDALLHGHSFTGHAPACATALAAQAAYLSAALNPNAATLQAADAAGEPLSLWGEPAATMLSSLPGVVSVRALGTVLAVELAAAGGAGSRDYGSSAAEAAVAALRAHGVFARPLGPVLYVLATPMTDPATMGRLVDRVKEVVLQLQRKGH